MQRTDLRVLAGPPPAAGPEPLAEHLARLGGLPSPGERRSLIPMLEASGLLGRGGAGFPVGRKWRSVAERADGRAVVVVNGAEGEPRSAKDRTLMTYRPHLVLDGALLAADAVGADEIVFYVGREHGAAAAALNRAMKERARELHRRARLVKAPIGYVSGEESAAVHYLNAGDARPTAMPPRPYERGVGGRPTLVQNVESVAYAALIARLGEAWYRSAGRAETRGTTLVTVSGAAARPGVREIELGTPLAELASLTEADEGSWHAILLGGYFGSWVSRDEAAGLVLDPGTLRSAGVRLGCGVVGFLPAHTCGVTATAQILDYLAGESAGQCGPCVFGLGAIAEAMMRLARNVALADDLAQLERWAGMVAGRGACHHPDGAVGLLHSAFRAFGPEFALHQRSRRCSLPETRAGAA